MTKFGPFPFVIGGHGNPPTGTLELDYTADVNWFITSASFTYTNVGQPQTFPVTFSAPVSNVYPGTSSMHPPLNIPGSGAYTGGTFAFNLTAGALTGKFTGPGGRIEDIIVEITWEADGLPVPKATPHAAAGGKY